MISIPSSVPALPLGIAAKLDTASIIIIVMVLGAVALVFWASRPSVIARYSVKNQPPGDNAAPGSGDLRV